MISETYQPEGYCVNEQFGQSFEALGISVMQYQQNFFPGEGSTGRGSGLKKPTTNMIAPTKSIGSPNTEVPKGTYRSVTRRNVPKTPRISPDKTRPRYIQTNTLHGEAPLKACSPTCRAILP